MARSTLAVPLAFAEDRSLVRPADARYGQQYRCPGCGAAVVLRQSELRRPHFAHRSGDGCSPESTLHRAAKHRLVEVIEEWTGGVGPRPCVARPCPRYSCEGGIVQEIPDDVTHASTEVRLDEGVVADVVLFRDEAPAAAIEIRVTHRVGAEKAERFTVPWVELSAEQVLERPYWWIAEQDGLLPFVCPACVKRESEAVHRLAEARDRAGSIARQLGLTLPPSPPYAWVPHSCWRCGAEMVAFLWPGGGDHSTRSPPAPIPSSLQHRATDGGGNYWANCCPSCSAVQGDYHLSRGNEAYALVREMAIDPNGPLADHR